MELGRLYQAQVQGVSGAVSGRVFGAGIGGTKESGWLRAKGSGKDCEQGEGGMWHKVCEGPESLKGQEPGC